MHILGGHRSLESLFLRPCNNLIGINDRATNKQRSGHIRLGDISIDNHTRSGAHVIPAGSAESKSLRIFGEVLLGIGVYNASLYKIAAVFACFNAFIRLYEEPHLAREFGAEYSAYKDEVGRWLPGIPK